MVMPLDIMDFLIDFFVTFVVYSSYAQKLIDMKHLPQRRGEHRDILLAFHALRF
ncbi:hypothetical protein CAL7102_06359 [Dulcicalothrix desertica PCC 7102]|nr:hypothetical protein CAL7102_06359 [Dulcicalothrix desertica PCC 7102]